jgi:hypothetical protein
VWRFVTRASLVERRYYKFISYVRHSHSQSYYRVFESVTVLLKVAIPQDSTNSSIASGELGSGVFYRDMETQYSHEMQNLGINLVCILYQFVSTFQPTHNSTSIHRLLQNRRNCPFWDLIGYRAMRPMFDYYHFLPCA